MIEFSFGSVVFVCFVFVVGILALYFEIQNLKRDKEVLEEELQAEIARHHNIQVKSSCHVDYNMINGHAVRKPVTNNNYIRLYVPYASGRVREVVKQDEMTRMIKLGIAYSERSDAIEVCKALGWRQ